MSQQGVVEKTKTNVLRAVSFFNHVVQSCCLCELRKERRLRVFENRVLRRVFGSKSDEETREWRNIT